jgi:Tol biopolymer transport system component
MTRLLLATMVLLPAVVLAVTPVNGTSPTLTPVTINATAGDQYDPHVSGDWSAYTSDISIRYYNFTSHADAQIPLGPSARDLLSDVSGSKIVFSRVQPGVKTGVMVFDAATAGAPIELDPLNGSVRLGSAIGGNSVAYVDFTVSSFGELVVHDLGSSTSVQLTNDSAFDQNPSVSPNGNVVTWEHCATSLTACDIWKAVKTGSTWAVSVASDSPSAEGNPDTNGTLIVYDSLRSTESDLYWRPVAAGAEQQLQMPGFQNNPSIAGNYLAFESRPTLFDTTDIFVYDLVANRVYQITNTPLVTEQLNDITVLPDGKVRVVWASDEDGFDQRNIKGATFALAATTSTCLNRNVVLDASRTYSPSHSNDATAVATPVMKFALPAQIPVTVGNSGNKEVTLSFNAGSSQTVSCRYKGGSSQAHPTSASELAKASKYLFDHCTGPSHYAVGTVVSADHFTLHVVNGDTNKPSTAVRASLAEVCPSTVKPPCRHGHDHDGDDDDDDHHGSGHHSDDLSAAPDAKPAPMGCSSTDSAPMLLMLLVVGAWLIANLRKPARVPVRARSRTRR